MNLPRIAVDAMGGDEGVRVMVSGAALARRRHERFKFLLVGDEARIKAALENHPNMREASEILHCEGVVSGEEKPTQALRRAKTTSMGLAIEAVKKGDALAVEDLGSLAHVRVVLERGLDARLVADEQELELVVAAARERGARDHHAHAFVTAHRIDSDTRQAHALILGNVGL